MTVLKLKKIKCGAISADTSTTGMTRNKLLSTPSCCTEAPEEPKLRIGYSGVEYNRGKVIRVIAFQSDALECRGGPSASL